MERPVRLVVFILVLLLFVPLLRQGRGVSPKRESAAFFHYSSGLAVIRVTGSAVSERIYRIHDGTTLGIVINMAVGPTARPLLPQERLSRIVTSGDVVEINRNSSQGYDITMKKMKARDRMILGIPLEPDAMDQADWEALPGIGPKLAQRIVRDRQLYGDFGSIEELKRVPGIGDGKILMINKFFLNK